jgi:hypothetical protein
MVLPINFEDGQVTTESFVDFNGGTGTVVDNPFITDDNPSSTVGKIVRDGGDIWAGSYLIVSPLDFTSETTIKYKSFTIQNSIEIGTSTTLWGTELPQKWELSCLRKMLLPYQKLR